MALVVFGDVHGKAHTLYHTVRTLEREGTPVTAALQVGDMQTLRSPEELRFLNAPAKHRDVGDFPDYFLNGSVPYPTFFIAGNHEQWDLLARHPRGGELLPNLHYLGRTGTRTLDGKVVAGLSGIYSPTVFPIERPHGNRPGKHHRYYTEQDLTTLAQMTVVDILLMHDWPHIHSLLGSSHDTQDPSLQEALQRDTGQKHLSELALSLNPSFIFCGHRHRPFTLTFTGNKGKTTSLICLDKVGKSEKDHYVIR